MHTDAAELGWVGTVGQEKRSEKPCEFDTSDVCDLNKRREYTVGGSKCGACKNVM